MSRKVLGRGLDALISHETVPAEAEKTDRIRRIPVDRITPNPHQPRRQFDESKLDELSRSIRERGILEPLIVRQTQDGSYHLIAGERRLRAAQKAGLTEVPAILRDFDGLDSLEVALIENLQREDLNPVDEARAYQRLIDQFNRTHAEISEKVGKDRSTVTNLVRLLRLPDIVLDEVSRGTLSVGHARVLLSIEDAVEQESLAGEMVRDGWSVREAERRLANRTRQQSRRTREKKAAQTAKSREVARVEEAMRFALGTEVHLLHTDKGGRIEILYSGPEELERILQLMGVRVH